jgi:hypothetical protein
MTPQQQARAEALVKKIFAAVPRDDETLISALAFCLLGAVAKTYDLSDRDAVEFCVKHFKTYAQVVWS